MTPLSDIFLRPTECAKRLSVSLNTLKRMERAGIICAHPLPLVSGERRFYWPDVVQAVKHHKINNLVLGSNGHPISVRKSTTA